MLHLTQTLTHNWMNLLLAPASQKKKKKKGLKNEKRNSD